MITEEELETFIETFTADSPPPMEEDMSRHSGLLEE